MRDLLGGQATAKSNPYEITAWRTSTRISIPKKKIKKNLEFLLHVNLLAWTVLVSYHWSLGKVFGKPPLGREKSVRNKQHIVLSSQEETV